MEKVVKESIDEILQTPVKDLRDDQIEFLEKIVEVDKQRKRAPGFTALFTGLSICTFIFGTINIFANPLSLIIAGWFSLAACIGLGGAAVRAYTKPDYKALSTNKWTFEDFVMNYGVEKVKEKLAEWEAWSSTVNIEDLTFNYLTNEVEMSHTSEKQVVQPDITNTQDNSIEQ